MPKAVIYVPCMCQECRKPFSVKPSQAKIGRGKFCSQACAYQHKTMTKIPRACQECGRTFLVRHSEDKRGGGKYCSHVCANKGNIIPIAARLQRQAPTCLHGIDCPYCCWPWQGKKNKQGYGKISNYDGAEWATASRVAWEVHHQKRLSPTLDCCHYCHNPACINFNHLHPGTRKENLDDSLRDHRIHRHSNGQFIKVLTASKTR